MRVEEGTPVIAGGVDQETATSGMYTVRYVTIVLLLLCNNSYMYAYM